MQWNIIHRWILQQSAVRTSSLFACSLKHKAWHVTVWWHWWYIVASISPMVCCRPKCQSLIQQELFSWVKWLTFSSYYYMIEIPQMENHMHSVIILFQLMINCKCSHAIWHCMGIDRLHKLQPSIVWSNRPMSMLGQYVAPVYAQLGYGGNIVERNGKGWCLKIMFCLFCPFN